MHLALDLLNVCDEVNKIDLQIASTEKLFEIMNKEHFNILQKLVETVKIRDTYSSICNLWSDY